MPELPEVQTTVNGLKDNITGLLIADIWTNYNSKYFKGSETIKDPAYFRYFKKETLGKRVMEIKRRGKNILINLSGGKTILVHMKMTGHLLYGLYKFNPKNKEDPWEPVEPESLKDPYNKRIRFLITFNNRRHLALSDTRKFAKIALIETKELDLSEHIKHIGPDPLENNFSFEVFLKILSKKPSWKIKSALTDQTLISGIGNIYADESLWRAGIHPVRKVSEIHKSDMLKIFRAIKTTLSKGIDFGGDSMSDYRNITGAKGSFQEEHRAYKKTDQKCSKKGCGGIIRRILVGGRATHYCDKHQIH